MDRVTRIFSRSADGETFGLNQIDVDEGFEWFPEVGEMYGRPVPIHPAVQIKNAYRLVGKTVATLSEYIILWFLREIGTGRMEPEDVELYCDGERIRIDKDGELIDKWTGGFYRERADLLFY
jgi:hypothetical protein